jgi:hypothetical protein
MEPLDVAIQNYNFWKAAYGEALAIYNAEVLKYNDLPHEDYQNMLKQDHILALENTCSKMAESRNFAHVIVTLHRTPKSKA